MLSHLGLKDNKENFVFHAIRDWKSMEMFLDVRRDMGVTGKSGNESRTAINRLTHGNQLAGIGGALVFDILRPPGSPLVTSSHFVYKIYLHKESVEIAETSYQSTQPWP